MAEPISITGALSLAANLTMKLSGLAVDLYRARDDILALQNEISDLSVVLAQWQSHAITPHNVVLRRFGDILNDITALQQSFSRLDKKGRKHFKREKWITQRTRLNRFKLELQHMMQVYRDMQNSEDRRILYKLQADLAALIATLCSSQDIHQNTSATEQGVEAVRSLVREGERLEVLETDSRTDLEVVERTPPPDGSSLMRHALSIESMHDAYASFTTTSQLPGISLEQTFPVTLGGCSLLCNCTCHRRLQARSSSLLNSVLGNLFIGYVGYPGVPCTPCSTSAASTIRVRYAFPGWFLRTSILFAVGRDTLGSPNASLRFTTRQPSGPGTLFHFAATGQVQHMKDLLRTQVSLVNELDAYGCTAFTHAMAWAFTARDFEPCLVLLRAGADLHIERDDEMTDYWSLTRQFYVSSHETTNTDWLSIIPASARHHDLPLIHKIVLKITHQSLQATLEQCHRSVVNATDHLGMTALHWASAIGDIPAARALLAAGADADLRDHQGSAPLHLAARYSGKVHLLLAEGCLVDPRDNGDWTPLMVATLNGHRHAVWLFYRYGACPNACNSFGSTALHLAVRYDKAAILKLLLRFKMIEINSRDRNGDTALSLAVRMSTTHAIQLLLKEYPSLDDVNIDGLSAWHLVALFGDMDLLRILMRRLLTVDTRSRTALGLTAAECFRYEVAAQTHNDYLVFRRSFIRAMYYAQKLQRNHNAQPCDEHAVPGAYPQGQTLEQDSASACRSGSSGSISYAVAVHNILQLCLE